MYIECVVGVHGTYACNVHTHTHMPMQQHYTPPPPPPPPPPHTHQPILHARVLIPCCSLCIVKRSNGSEFFNLLTSQWQLKWVLCCVWLGMLVGRYASTCVYIAHTCNKTTQICPTPCTLPILSTILFTQHTYTQPPPPPTHNPHSLPTSCSPALKYLRQVLLQECSGGLPLPECRVSND